MVDQIAVFEKIISISFDKIENDKDNKEEQTRINHCVESPILSKNCCVNYLTSIINVSYFYNVDVGHDLSEEHRIVHVNNCVKFITKRLVPMVANQCLNVQKDYATKKDYSSLTFKLTT